MLVLGGSITENLVKISLDPFWVPLSRLGAQPQGPPPQGPALGIDRLVSLLWINYRKLSENQSGPFWAPWSHLGAQPLGHQGPALGIDM